MVDNESEIEQLMESLTLQQQKTEQERLKFENELSVFQALIEARAKREDFAKAGRNSTPSFTCS